MSSATSTKGRTASGVAAAGPSAGLQAWQFFVLAGLACATGVTFVVRGRGVQAVVLGTLLVAAAAAVGYTVLRTVRPLFGGLGDDASAHGFRRRAELEREKALALRTIKELEFDHAMGKVSDADYDEMRGRLRQRAARLIRELDQGGSLREAIERDLAARLASGQERVSMPDAVALTCARCGTSNEPDARFCKACGDVL